MPLGTTEIILILVVLGLPLCLIALLVFVLLRYSKNRMAKETKLCPHCAERIQKAAKVCRYCQRDL